MSYITIDPIHRRAPLEVSSVDEFKEANWDGEDAHAVLDDTINRAKEFLCFLPVNVVLGKAMAGVDGSLGIYWTKGAAELYVDFRPEGRTRYFYRSSDTHPLERILPVGHTTEDIFNAISVALPWFKPMTDRLIIRHPLINSQMTIENGLPVAPNKQLNFFPDQSSGQYLQAA